MISIKNNFLFVHIPKTAGNSVQLILKEYSEDEVFESTEPDGYNRFGLRSNNYKLRKHSKLKEYKYELENELYKKLFKFTIVRNPWDRMISYYFSPHRGHIKWDRNEFIKFVKKTPSVNSFLSLGFLNNFGSRPFKNIDFFLRFENLDQDFNKLCDELGIKRTKIPHSNISDHKHYSYYYDKKLVELVSNRFSSEIKYFGYNYIKE